MLFILIFFGGSELSNCVFPGNKKEGYCNLKERISTSSPFLKKASANELLKFAIPPL